MAAKSTRKPAKPSAARQRAAILDAALELAAAGPWNGVTFVRIAQASQVSLSELYGQFPGRMAIWRALMARADERVLAETDTGSTDESVRDRLFDILMRRFDVLAENRDGVISMARGIACDPAAAMCAAPTLMKSMRWMLEATGVSTAGVCGSLRVKGLAAVYASAFRIWMRDDSEDMSRTMAALDKSLERAEKLSGIRVGRRPRKEQDGEDPVASPSPG